MELLKIIDLLQQMVLEGRHHFSPIYICDRLKINNVKEVTEFLLSKYCVNTVKPNFEVECPEGDTDFSVEDLGLLVKDTVTCHHCGIEYIPDPKRIWITFNFVDSFIEEVKKKKAMNQCHPPLVKLRQAISIM